MIRINQIKTNIHDKEDVLNDKIFKLIRTKSFKLERIVKKSIDSRDKNNIKIIYSVDISSEKEKEILRNNINNKNIMLTSCKKYSFPFHNYSNKNSSPLIVGAGPAGYFCALYLARAGYNPVLIEQGKPVEERTLDVEEFWKGGQLSRYSNVSFGEGGAGTFSDGKLNTGIKDPMGRIDAVINDFIRYGAPEDIGYLAKPHIGTDELKTVLVNMRNEIQNLGGTVLFGHKLADIKIQNDNIIACVDKLNLNESIEFKTDALILAIGHSSRDTFHMLYERKLDMEAKAFAIGVRVEHPRTLIDAGQYGDSDEAKCLPAASYKMTFRSSMGRSVYSFCMCPGGFVVNASTDANQCVVNGMSNHARDEINSNSAIVVNVTPEDFIAEGFGDYGVLAGVEFQKKYEALAYKEGRGSIPVQLFKDFKAGKASSTFGTIRPNIKGSYTFGDLNNCLPAYVINGIIEGIEAYDKKLHGFADPDTILSGIETRTSSPVRIIRNEDFMSGIKGIFPCGEGAGYAGGITSAAVDGIKVAEAVAAYYEKL